MTSKLDYAAKAATLGFAVFPLRYNSKLPALAHWQDKATTEPEELERWFKGKSRNIGIATGPSGLLVVDIDMKSTDGRQQWKSLCAGRKAPPTYAVKTPSGGLHLYYRGEARSSAGKLASAIDIRSSGGLVVAPGSSVGGGTYEVVLDHEVVPAPTWLTGLCGKPLVRPAALVDWDERDTSIQCELAAKYLSTEEPAVEGASGDETTLKVAMRVLDFGVSVERAHELMLGWNDTCQPPWGAEELYDKITNAARYRKLPVGIASPQADFYMVVEEDASAFDGIPAVRRFSQRAIPPRQWIWGNYLLRDYITVLVAAPGAGKSTLALEIALAVITGRKDITGVEVVERGAVMLVNNEDDANEVRRRVSACLSKWKIDWSEIEDKLFLWTAERGPWKIAVRNLSSRALKPEIVDADIEALKTKGIALFVADPFIETHDGEENDNREINEVGRLYRTMAKSANCSVLLVHHTRKMTQGGKDTAINIESARGAGSLIGVARVGLTLHQMTDKDAEHYGVKPDTASAYVRLDHAKANLSRLGHGVLWYEKEEVVLDNGDAVGVLAPVKMESADKAKRAAMAECFIANTAEEGSVRVVTAATWLTDDPLFASSSRTALGKEIRALFAETFWHQGWGFVVEEEQRGERSVFILAAYRDNNT
jgi:bifunctional DNA primase/polymerase-like protein/AAA domain-containing protein